MTLILKENQYDYVAISLCNRGIIQYRDLCWAKCYELLADFQQGNIEMPTVDYVLNELPVLDWNNL